MSVQDLGWVFDNSPTEGVARLCLLALANHTDDQHQTWVSIARVAREANCHEDTAKRILVKLHDSGHITRAIQGSPDARQRDDRRTNLYTLTVDLERIKRLAKERSGKALPKRGGNRKPKAPKMDGGDLPSEPTGGISDRNGGDLPSEREGSPVPDGRDLSPPLIINEPSENHQEPFFLSLAADAATASNDGEAGQPALFDPQPDPQPDPEPAAEVHAYTAMFASVQEHLTDASNKPQIGQTARDLLAYGYEPDQLPALASVLAHLRNGNRTVATGRKWGRTAEAMQRTQFVHAHHAEAVRLVEAAWRAYQQKRLALGDSDRYRTAYVVADLLASGFDRDTVVDAMKTSTSWTPGALRQAIRESASAASTVPARRRPTAADNADAARARQLRRLGLEDVPDDDPSNVLPLNRGA